MKDRPLSRKAQPLPKAVISTPATAGPISRADWKLAELRLTALRSSSWPTISDDERLPGGVVEDGDQAEDEGDQVDVPDLHMAAEGEHGEGEAGQAHGGLGEQQQLALGEAVGDDAAVEPEEQHRQELQRGGDADRGGGAGEAEHQPVLGDALHPGAGVGHHLAGGEEPVVTDS